MGAKNAVVNGDYKGKAVFQGGGKAFISPVYSKTLDLNGNTIDSYEILYEQHQKSVVSAVGRAAVGGALLGPAGLLAGLSARTKGVYYIAIQFKDGKRSLLEVNDKIYKAIIKGTF